MSTDLTPFAAEDFCYLTTTGRVSGHPHTIEIWFALHDHTLYILSGGRERSDWVRNILKQPNITVKIKDRIFKGSGRPVTDPEEDALARTLVREKYASADDDLSSWAKTSLPIAIDLAEGQYN